MIFNRGVCLNKKRFKLTVFLFVEFLPRHLAAHLASVFRKQMYFFASAMDRSSA